MKRFGKILTIAYLRTLRARSTRDVSRRGQDTFLIVPVVSLGVLLLQLLVTACYVLFRHHISMVYVLDYYLFTLWTELCFLTYFVKEVIYFLRAAAKSGLPEHVDRLRQQSVYIKRHLRRYPLCELIELRVFAGLYVKRRKPLRPMLIALLTAPAFPALLDKLPHEALRHTFTFGVSHWFGFECIIAAIILPMSFVIGRKKELLFVLSVLDEAIRERTGSRQRLRVELADITRWIDF